MGALNKKKRAVITERGSLSRRRRHTSEQPPLTPARSIRVLPPLIKRDEEWSESVGGAQCLGILVVLRGPHCSWIACVSTWRELQLDSTKRAHVGAVHARCSQLFLIAKPFLLGEIFENIFFTLSSLMWMLLFL